MAGAALLAVLAAGCAYPGVRQAPAASTITVTRVVDGDTVVLSTGQHVRIIGIDTPESGECGFDQATAAMRRLVERKAVTAPGGARDNVDSYGRLLRYIDVAGTDSGLSLIKQGLAVARYDSRDGYGRHPREAAYVAADAASPAVCPPGGGMYDGGGVYYENCTAARNAGAAPILRGQPGYRSALDGDNDGIACE
jgi:micrococcal nuclease